jgi:aminoglycoside phosphotransferase (APT) family kinase protein
VVAREENQERLDGLRDVNATTQEANVGTTPVREGYGFDEEALARWMRRHVEGFSGPLAVEQFKGGQSNPTYKLLTPTACYVLRRKPNGVTLPGAHDVEREARILAALHKVRFPVAAVHGVCTDETVIGTRFFVMQMIEGRIFWDATLPGILETERPAYYDAMNRTIAALHNIDYTSIGLADFGKPGNYISRQISRWSKQYLQDLDAGRDADMDRLIEWLPAHIPDADESSIAHGDLRCDNIIFHPSEPIVLAVLDWELSTIGHPLADFAYHALMYRMPPQIVAGLRGADVAALSIPSEEQYVAAYCERTGRHSIPAYDFYVTFNFFRLAAIFHGIKGRVLRGNAVSAQAAERAQSFPMLARLARESMD